LLLLSMRHSWIIKTYLELVQVLKTTSQLSSHDKMRTIATATKVLQCSKHAMTWTTVTGWLDHQSFTDHSALERVWPIELSQLSIYNKVWTTATCWLGPWSCNDMPYHHHNTLFTLGPMEWIRSVTVVHAKQDMDNRDLLTDDTVTYSQLGQNLLIHNHFSLWTIEPIEVSQLSIKHKIRTTVTYWLGPESKLA